MKRYRGSAIFDYNLVQMIARLEQVFPAEIEDNVWEIAPRA